MKAFPLSPTIGTIPDHQIIGRDQEIISLLRLLKGQSVSVEQIRRMGKSMLLKKLSYLCNKKLLPEEFKNESYKAKYFSFQGKQNLGEVIDMLIKELEQLKDWYKIDFSKTYTLLRKIVNSPKISYAGAEFTINLPEYKKNWKDIFFSLLDDIAERQERNNSKLILIFDELPIMLWEWHKEQKHDEAMELLDILRERRGQLETKGIRFIYCGSIGIKVVLNTFRKEFGYTGEPTNEMEDFTVESMIKTEADLLCECFLLSGFEIDQEIKIVCWNLIYKHTNGLPFYMSKIFNIIQTDYDKLITEETIANAYHKILNEPTQHKAFNQLKDRLTIYYAKEDADIMLRILSVLSNANDYISEEDITNKLPNQNTETKDSLYKLFGDNYLVRKIENNQRYYKFKYEIFKLWWKINLA
jgi:hypothetical protein